MGYVIIITERGGEKPHTKRGNNYDKHNNNEQSKKHYGKYKNGEVNRYKCKA